MYRTAGGGARQPIRLNPPSTRVNLAPNTDPSGRLLLLLGTRRRRLRLGRWRGRGGAADTELVHRGVVELTARGQAFLRLVVAERRRRTGAHHAIDRAGTEALVAKRLLCPPDVTILGLRRELGLVLGILVALHLVDDLVLRLDHLVLGFVGFLLDLVHRRLGLGLGLVLGALGLVLDLVLGALRLVLHLVGRSMAGGGATDPHGADQDCNDTRECFCHGTTS